AWVDDLRAFFVERHGIVQHGVAVFHRAGSGPGLAWTSAAAAFGVVPQTLDAEPEAARAAVNRWTRDHTACLIPELFTGPWNATPAAVLVDAVAVVADWVEPFRGGDTLAFHREDGSTVDVPMVTGPVYGAGLADVGGARVLRLP